MTALLAEEPRRYRVPPSLIRKRRKAMEGDIWLFYKWIWVPCLVTTQHPNDRAVERFHRPLLYMFDGDADRLAWCVIRADNDPKWNSAIIDAVRSECQRLDVDYRTPEGVRALRKRLTRFNDRMARGLGKTTFALVWVHKVASFDPNASIAIASKSDPAAFSFCETIGNVMRTQNYAIYFPDRLHRLSNGKFDLRANITQEFIRMAGRTYPKQQTIEARGLRKQWPSLHFTHILGDDLSGTETADASMDQALTWLTNIDAISNPPGEGQPTRVVLNGTKQGGKDDFAVTTDDPTYFSIRVPLWTKNVPSSLANVKKDGVPTVPEFRNLENIREWRASAAANPKFGYVWFMRNCELSDELGALHFTEDLLRRQSFLWKWRQIRNKRGEIERRRFMRRYLFDDNQDPKTGKEPHPGPCECYLHCKLTNHAFVEFDPLTLPRVMGVDQAVTRDPWAVSCIARDPFGFLYWLRGMYGRGYAGIPPAVVEVFNRYGGLGNPVRKIGIETGGMQTITVYWMQQGEIMGDLARRVIPVPAGHMPKVERLFNNILTPLLLGTLFVDPEDRERTAEMYDYDASKNNPTDGILDAGAIASFIHTIPARDPKADYTALMEARRQLAERVDPETGIDLSLDWLEDATSVDLTGDSVFDLYDEMEAFDVA